MLVIPFRSVAVIALAALAGGCHQAKPADTPVDAVASPYSPPFDPRGIYHNAFSGAFSGTEWFQVIPTSVVNHFVAADIFGGGFGVTVDSAGQITIDNGIGAGSFSSQDRFVVKPTLGGTLFTFDSMRAPDTTAELALSPSPAVAGSQALAGTYTSQTTQLDPRTGDVIGDFEETVTIAVAGDTYRITDPQGLFFQGVFRSPTRVSFRVVTPSPKDERFQSLPGSSINFAQNMVGEATLIDANNWKAIVLLQSRTELGSQTQLAFRFRATRQ